MADLKNMVVGTILFIALVSGFYTTFNSWYSRSGSSVSLDNSKVNFTDESTALDTWAKDSSSAISNANVGIPILSAGFVVLTGVFQSISLFVNTLPKVMLSIFSKIGLLIGLPAWFTAFVTILLLATGIIAIINAMKGSTGV